VIRSVIEATDLSFAYDDDVLVEDVDLGVETGECVLLCGPSGCGKTTLGKCLSGIVPTLDRQGEMAGTVTLDGKPTDELSKSDLAETVDAVFENPEAQIIGLSVEEDIAFGCENAGMDADRIRETVGEVLDQFKLRQYRDRDPRHLSGGEKQRLALASAIATDPDVLMLDDPVSQLDPAGSETALGVLRRQKRRGKTMLLLARKLGPEIQLADRVVALADGQVVAEKPPREFVRDTSLLERLGMWFPERSPETGGSPDARDRGEANLSVENLWYSYRSDGDAGADIEWAIEEVSAEIPTGTVVGIVGHNGSGKTTLSKQLNGLYTPNHGSIRFRGEPLSRTDSGVAAGTVGYVFQNPDRQIFTTTVRKEVAYGPENLGYGNVDERIETALAQVGLGHLEDGRTGTLSRGQKQRVAIASVLAIEPEVLILDEPSSGIDYRTFWELMDELVGNYLTPERSIVLVSHDANVVREWTDVVVEMDDGTIQRQVPTADIPDGDHWGGETGSPQDLLDEPTGRTSPETEP